MSFQNNMGAPENVSQFGIDIVKRLAIRMKLREA
jgi:hypothetical protein